MSEQTAIVVKDNPQAIISLVIDGLNSPHSKRAYGKALSDFMNWYMAEGKPGLSKMTVQRYKAVLQGRGLSPSAVNLALSAIRKLGQEAADNGLIEQSLANGVARVKGVKMQGVRAGNWLTREQAQELLNLPDTTTLKGMRDRAVLAVMIGGGLRRSEVANLKLEQIVQREGRWVIIDLLGKGNRVRTVPIPSWTKAAIDAWTQAAGITSGLVFCAINKGGRLAHEGMTAQAVRDVVVSHGKKMGIHLAAHDLRRTFARLARKGGAGLDQIQLSLGHASIKTTERYLGVTQDLMDAPCDRLGVKL
ncbi:MAG: tyrosine-type recombinase/integrase [Anaerolineae bacterium]|nr:tyrosine-type recombinase/integrase [Anaerolineae bacterium]